MTLADPIQSTAFAGLTDRQRLALTLEHAGFSQAEIARRMGIKNQESVCRLLARARRAMKAFAAAFASYTRGLTL